MEQVTFVILHYFAMDATVRCVESILSKIAYENYQIVIIDNASPNYSGKKLEQLYKKNIKIKVILSECNLGFSGGNNIGYKYAIKYYDAEFIIVINNDTEILQQDFIENVIKIYKESGYYILGPDIINLEGIHQSPQRNHIITKKEAKLWYIKRCLISCYLHLHKRLKLSDNSYILKKFRKHDVKRIQCIHYNEMQENVELQGACTIFSPQFIKKNNIAFEEKTFMYGEEAILSLKCSQHGWKQIYNPMIRILHAEKSATKLINGDGIDMEIFLSDNHVKAIKELLNIMKM